jgi:hypothetical protein
MMAPKQGLEPPAQVADTSGAGPGLQLDLINGLVAGAAGQRAVSLFSVKILSRIAPTTPLALPSLFRVTACAMVSIGQPN